MNKRRQTHEREGEAREGSKRGQNERGRQKTQVKEANTGKRQQKEEV